MVPLLWRLINLMFFFDKSGFGEVMTLVDVNPTERTWMSARGGEGVNRRFKIITV